MTGHGCPRTAELPSTNRSVTSNSQSGRQPTHDRSSSAQGLRAVREVTARSYGTTPQEIADLRRQLKNNRQVRQQLQDQVDAAAAVIAALLTESAALREQATKQSTVIIPLDRTHFISE